MPKFNKTLDELKTRFDKWLYVLKNLERLHNIPEKFQDRIFKKLFKSAEIAAFTPEEVMQYEDSLKVYRDIKNSLDTAREEGFEQGLEKKAIATAVLMISDNEPIEKIGKYTGLSVEAIENLRKNQQQVKEPAAKYHPGKKKKPTR